MKVVATIAGIIKEQFRNKSGIVYCLSKKDCEKMAADLSRAGVKAKPYHAGLGKVERERTQDQWLQVKLSISHICVYIIPC